MRLNDLLENNRRWAQRISTDDPGFFAALARLQAPEHLWIGCADSRVPANEIVGMAPGELFVHRNVANLVIHSDLNCLSVLQYAVDHLKVKHVIVCGHYGCGGVRAAVSDHPHGLVDNWLRSIRDLQWRRRDELARLPTEDERIDRLCELNVVEQTVNVGNTTVIRDAWRRHQSVTLHGWIYGLADGLVKDLGISVASLEELRGLKDRR